MFLAAIGLFLVQDDPKAVFLQVLNKYAGHKSGQLTIEHHDSSGLFPGHFVQELKWRKDKRFELRVVQQPETKGGASPKFDAVPSYYCNGKNVATMWPDGRVTQDPISQENSMPGWEVTTTPVLSWIMGTPNKKYFSNPPDGIKVDYAWKGEADYDGAESKLIELTFTLQGLSQVLQVYVSPQKDKLLGMKFELNGKRGSVAFREQQFDITLPATLGTIEKKGE